MRSKIALPNHVSNTLRYTRSECRLLRVSPRLLQAVAVPVSASHGTRIDEEGEERALQGTLHAVVKLLEQAHRSFLHSVVNSKTEDI